MKKVILNLAASLDGFIEGPNGEVDWCIMDDDMNFDAFIASVDTIFYGRISYDAWGNFQAGENDSEAEKSMWKGIHAKRKFVFSSEQRQDKNATYIAADIAEEVAKIKNQTGGDIWLYGGASLIKTFINLGLIDLYKIAVHPVVLGRGKPLFEDLKARIGLKLIDHKVFRSGVIELTYEPEKA